MSSVRWYAVRQIATEAHRASAPGSAPWSQRLASVPRLARSVLSGTYRGLSPQRLLLMVAAVAYVVSPVDLMPEAVLGILGFGDDALAIAWVAAALAHETQSFLDWERGPQDVTGGAAGPYHR